jgi:hypothetical protein
MSGDVKQAGCGHESRGGFCFGPAEPDCLAALPPRQRRNVLIDSDLCVIGDQQFFIRGCLDLPILGTPYTFTWLVWVSLSRKSFDRAIDVWELTGRESEPPYFGWLNTRIPCYPDTAELKTNVHTTPVGNRPLIVLEPGCHPLAIEQQQGITLRRAESMAKQIALEWT